MLTKRVYTLAFLIVGILGLLRIDTFEVQAIPITIVASGADYYDRPRINDNDEIVWSQRSNGSYQVWSNIRGQISFGQLDRDPDINNNGEIIWRYGDGGRGPNGISSNIRGNIYSSTGIDPYYDTHRINNVGEIIWTSDRNGGIFSNIRGQLTRNNSGYDRQTAVNDLGDVVSASYSYAQDRNIYDIISTGGGFITNDSAWQLSPDINNMGEIVWGQRVDGAFRNSEIWSPI